MTRQITMSELLAEQENETETQAMARRKKLDRFVKDDDRKWQRDDDGEIIGRKIEDFSLLSAGAKNGQQTTVYIEEPAEKRSQTLRTYNILVYSMYFPMEVRDFLVEEFPKKSAKTNLGSTAEMDFVDTTSTNVIEQNFGTINTVVRRHGITKIAETLNEIEREDACGYEKPQRYMLRTAEKTVNANRPDKYHAVIGPVTPHTEALYRTNGNPQLVTVRVGSALSW